jgi:hypothetical protein
VRLLAACVFVNCSIYDSEGRPNRSRLQQVSTPDVIPRRVASNEVRVASLFSMKIMVRYLILFPGIKTEPIQPRPKALQMHFIPSNLQ